MKDDYEPVIHGSGSGISTEEGISDDHDFIIDGHDPVLDDYELI